MDHNRPDPDAVLARVQAEEGREGKGKLKVFFGFAAGVGKTYTMLETARRDVSSGRDVWVGVVETHGRSDTAALLLGMEILPLKEIDYRGVTLKEFDLDGTLKLRPELIIVDELAHTNAPGSRHAKRWQDVEELLAAGIDVYTTLNVQHLESLNDIVAQITGVIVQETVPDAVLERADEIELVDLPPEDLLDRFRHGHVYVPAQAQRAMDHFFKKANLIALRELAIRLAVRMTRGDNGLGLTQTSRRSVVGQTCGDGPPSRARCVSSFTRSAICLRANSRKAIRFAFLKKWSMARWA